MLESAKASEKGAEAALCYALKYLSAENRDDVQHSCTFAAAGSGLVRADSKTRHIASEAFKETLEGMAPLMRTGAGEDRLSAAISLLTNMIGALTMSRMVDDRALSDRILEVTRERLIRSMESAAKKRRASAEVAVA